MYHTIVRRRVKATFAALNRGDYEPALAGMAEQFEHRFAGDHALGGTRHDRSAMRRWFERLFRLNHHLAFDLKHIAVSGGPWDTTAVVEWTDSAQLADGTQYLNTGVHVVRMRWDALSACMPIWILACSSALAAGWPALAFSKPRLPRSSTEMVAQGAARKRTTMTMTIAEKLLAFAMGLGVLHHVDHILRVDHSGWPFRADVTPFTFSLIVYPIILAIFRLRSRPWLRVAGSALIFGFVTFSHSHFETPFDQFHTWAHGSRSPDYLGTTNALGLQSSMMGAAAVVLTIALSTAFLVVTAAFWREARRPK